MQGSIGQTSATSGGPWRRLLQSLLGRRCKFYGHADRRFASYSATVGQLLSVLGHLFPSTSAPTLWKNKLGVRSKHDGVLVQQKCGRALFPRSMGSKLLVSVIFEEYRTCRGNIVITGLGPLYVFERPERIRKWRVLRKSGPHL